MSFEDDVKLISGYNEWVQAQRIRLNDLTAEAYLEDRMRQDAADRVLKAIEYIDEWGEWDEKSEEYDISPTTREVRELELILRGLV